LVHALGFEFHARHLIHDTTQFIAVR
jgi:hypothetical protein